MIIHLAMDQDSSSIIKEAISQIMRRSHHLMVTRAVEVVEEVVVAAVEVVSIQVIVSRDPVEDMDSSQVVTEDSRVVMATKAMGVCITCEQT